MKSKSVKIIFSFILMIIIFGSINFVYANSDLKINAMKIDKNVDLNKDSYVTTVSPSLLKKYEDAQKIDKFFSSKFNPELLSIGANDSSSYDLRDHITVHVKDQGNTQTCWAFSIMSSAETNLLIRTSEDEQLSVKHMDYSTSQSFYDGPNPYGFNRRVGDSGSFTIALSYLTNGKGAILERQMPFNESMRNLSLEDIDIAPTYYAKSYEKLPMIYKSKDGSGNIIYSNGSDTIYSDDDVQAIRQMIKDYITQNGAIGTYTCASASQYYNSSTPMKATAYYCDNETTAPDHGIAIIGWDDNYSRENFTGKSKPPHDGAWLILNSWGEDNFDHGTYWISYDDFIVERALYGLTGMNKIDYDLIYQHDIFGATVPLVFANGAGEPMTELYLASVYTRDATQGEELNKVGISSNQYARYDVYVNTNGNDLNINNLQLVAQTDLLKPGYNMIEFDPVTLTGDKFAIVVKQASNGDEPCAVMIEAPIEGTMYTRATSNPGDSQLSPDGENWQDVDGTVDYGSIKIDMSQADVCIKAFTNKTGENVDPEPEPEPEPEEPDEPEPDNPEPDNPDQGESIVASDVYDVGDEYITKVIDNTTIQQFLDNMILQNVTYEFVKDGKTVSDYNSLVTTNMLFKTSIKTYKIVVRGDTNGDGVITTTDLSKEVLHFVGYQDMTLTGAFEKATDINLDGKLSITDLSQLTLIFVNN